MAVTAPESTPVTPAAPSPSPNAPATTTPASTGESQQTPQSGDGATPPAPATDIDALVRQRIAEYDPNELKRLNRKFANVVGNEADRLANERLNRRIPELRAELEAHAANQREADELRELRDSNPELYVQREKDLEARLAKQQVENLAMRAREDAAVTRAREESDVVLREWAQNLPEPVLTKLREIGQIDEGDWAASRRKFQQVATDLYRDYLKGSVAADEIDRGVAKKLELELAKRSKELETGVKQAVAAEANASDRSPDTGGGGASPSGPMGQAEFDRIRSDPSLRRANKDRIAAGVNAGQILR